MSQLTLKNAAGEAVTYDFLNNTANSTSYIGTEHSDLQADLIVLTSVNPTRRATDYGNRRGKSNLQRGIVAETPIGDSVVKNAKLEVSSSVPVGMPFAEFKEFCARQAAFLMNDEYCEHLFMQGRTEQ